MEVMLACNDRNGNLDTLSMVEVGSRDGDAFMTLEGDILDGDYIDIVGGRLKLEGFDCTIRSHGKYVGNMCWDQVTMSGADAARLVNHLRGLKHWTCTEAYDPLFALWDQGVKFEAKDLEEMDNA